MAPIGCLFLRVPSFYKTQPAEAVNPLLSPNARIQELNGLVRIGYLETARSEKPLVSSLLPHTDCSDLSHSLQSHYSKQKG